MRIMPNYSKHTIIIIITILFLINGCTSPQNSVIVPEPTIATEETPAAPTTTIHPSPVVATPTPTPRIRNSVNDVFSYKGLIDVISLDSDFIIDLKYATNDNFTGITHYETELCLINKDAGAALLKALDLAQQDGYTLKLFDVYRPISVQQALSDSAPPELRQYVPAPSQYSQHCRGIAVDCTLVDANGNELDMPSQFDDFSEKAHVNYAGATQIQKDNRAYLIRIMESAGFKVNSLEWWHFYLPNVTNYDRLDITLTEFIKQRNL